ncbi:MAG TPA: cadherin-like domain-containing protein, partial [Verrucomicrobiae bacterium]|nr:cadherin-like domain-containing protein [Verrucomicrobiae bacterium]
TGIYSGDANDAPATNTLAQIVTNHPPTALPASYTRAAGAVLDIAVADLATNWSDVDGDTVSLVAVGVSTNGVTLANIAGILVYSNANNVADQFLCTIADGWGGTNFQTVNIAVTLSTNAAPSITLATGNPNGTFTLRFAGAPGTAYILQTTESFSPPVQWSPVATNTAGGDGTWQFTDTQAPNFQRRFYRLQLAQ